MSTSNVVPSSKGKAKAFSKYKDQAKRLGFESSDDIEPEAVEAKWITSQDPVVETGDGERLPSVPINEALKLNKLKREANGNEASGPKKTSSATRQAKDGSVHGAAIQFSEVSPESEQPEHALPQDIPPAKTNPLFPPLPLYGPPSFLRGIQCWVFRFSSAILSFNFLSVIILGSLFTSLPAFATNVSTRLLGKNPDAKRPFFEEEKRREEARKVEARNWNRKKRRRYDQNADKSILSQEADEENGELEFEPTEGGPDPLICDAQYYAKRVGLDLEIFDVQTEDGFVIELWHVYNPSHHSPKAPELRRERSAHVFRKGDLERDRSSGSSAGKFEDGNRKYPVLLIHGLLQSAGAYCCNDDDSLAFYLAKSGYDVFLGNNRCGFKPRHRLLHYNDPRMWAWNIRQMGVMDLPALISRVLEETKFPKLGLICHSQGTTQAMVALAKEQRPDIGEKISVFCALAPAAYAGSLVQKMYFKFMQIITPGMFRVVFGIHAFIPFMMHMHAILPGSFYGAMGYQIFSFLFDWTDERWDKGLRHRFFQFSPVYISSESMRWWLGRECFAKQKCILSTRDEGRLEDEEDREEDEYYENGTSSDLHPQLTCNCDGHVHKDHGRYSWYDHRAPPFALWIAGNDKLVDGRRLLRRFNRGREPFVDVVHTKVIDNYEHLDVIWAMDSIEQVGREVKEVIWKTVSESSRAICRGPVGCDKVEVWESNSTGTSRTSKTLDSTAVNKENLNGLSEDHRAESVTPNSKSDS